MLYYGCPEASHKQQKRKIHYCYTASCNALNLLTEGSLLFLTLQKSLEHKHRKTATILFFKQNYHTCTTLVTEIYY